MYTSKLSNLTRYDIYIYIVRYHIPVKIICEGIINNDLCDVYIWFAKKIEWRIYSNLIFNICLK